MRVGRIGLAVVLGGLLLGPGHAVGSEDSPTRSGQRRARGSSVNEKNHASVKSAFGDAVSQVSAATVRFLVNGKNVALGAVVDPEGYIVSKASLLEGELTCRLDDGRELEAEIVGVKEDYDLALLKVAADDLTPVPWRTEDVSPPGSLVAAVAPGGNLLAVGVVSAEPRTVRGPTRLERERGWLGIALGGGESGLGVTTVYRESAARKAGLRVGDRIKSINGTTMKSASQVVQTVGRRSVGEDIKLLVEREDEELELAATLGKQQAGRLPQDHWGGGPFSRRRQGFPLALPHDTAVHPTDCGGPLIDTDGNVLGINVARALRVTTYAIPADVVRRELDEIRQDAAKSAKAE